MPAPFLRTAVALTALTISPAVLFSSSLCPGGCCGLKSAQSQSAPAQDFRSETAAPHPAMVRILVENSQTQNYGTGTLIRLNSNRNAVLTCAHLFESVRPERITVFFPNHQSFQVRIQAINRDWDAALLTADPGVSVFFSLTSGINAVLTGTTNIPHPVELASTPPIPGDFLRFSGFGPNGNCVWTVGTFRGYCRLGRASGCHTMVISGSARQGDSGGPVFTLDGQLAGVLWGTDGQSVYGTWAGKILEIFSAEFQETALSLPPRPRLVPNRPKPEPPAPVAKEPRKPVIPLPEPKSAEPPKQSFPFLLFLLLYFPALLLPAGLGWWWVKKYGGKTSMKGEA